MQLVEDLRFDDSYSFLYSPRPGTPAASLADDTPHEAKLARLARLQARIEALAAGLQPGDGRQPPARAGGRAGQARSARTRRAHRQQPCRQLRGRRAAHRQLRRVTITAAVAHTLRGEIALVPA